MTEDDLNAPDERSAGTDGALREHEVRTALLDLLAEVGTVTATEAAARLGYSSGLCSFHLRQLARHGYLEEAPTVGAGHALAAAAAPSAADGPMEGQFGDLARGLEDELAAMADPAGGGAARMAP